jgi:acetyltransferase-like isoleucine patch superfamily enzyme
VRGSVVADGCRIANNAIVELSILGEGCAVMNGCTVQFSTLYPRTLTMARLVGFSLLGQDGFVGDGVTLTDFRFDGRDVIVLKDGKPVQTEALFLGGCLGHGVYLGAGCVVAPGRAVPNGLRITPDASRIILRPETEGLPGFHNVRPTP